MNPEEETAAADHGVFFLFTLDGELAVVLTVYALY